MVVGESLEPRQLLTTFYVDVNNPAASDANAGVSIASPLKSINQAFILAGANNATSQTDTILIRGGVYHEMPFVRTNDSGASPTSRTVISAYFNTSSGGYEPVYIDAADPTTGTWIEDGTTNRWYLPSFTAQTAGVWVDWGPTNDGASLQQIGYYSGSETASSRKVVGSGLADMYAGTYWGDTTDSRLCVWLSDGSNPNNHVIEYANRSRAIYQPGTVITGGYSYAQYLDFENLRLRHANVYNQVGQDPGVGIYLENDQRMINCDVQWNTRDGIHLLGASQLQNCTADNNGANGVSCKGQGWLINGGQYNYNFWRVYNDGGDAAIKAITNSAAVWGSIENVEAAYNLGKGIWYDTCYATTVTSDITGNYIHDNTDNGIDLEASKNFLVANNVIVNNAQSGIIVNAAENAVISNNTLVGNQGIAAIELDGGSRVEEYNSPTIIGTENVSVDNNIIANNFSTYDLDIPTSKQPSANTFGNTSDYNLFYRRGDPLHFTTGGTYSGWAQTPSALSDWQANSGQDAHSIAADPLFVSGGTGASAYSIGYSSPAVTAGLVQASLFTTDFAGVSRPASAGYDLGAFQHSTTSPGNAGPIYGVDPSVWLDDELPANAAMTAPDATANTGENQFITWTSSTAYAGAVAVDSTDLPGAHRQYFTNANARLISSGDSLFAYVWIDPSNIPGEILFEWQDSTGSWGHDTYWGGNLLTTPVSGSSFTPQFIGALPTAGSWALLSVPAATVGLAGVNVTGFSFDLYNGRALLDKLGNGMVIVATPSIAGKVFLDSDANGILDPSETGLAGVTVFLDLNGDNQLDPGDPSIVTDSAGNYAFYNLSAGSYTPEQIVPGQFAATPLNSTASAVTVTTGSTSVQNLGEFPIDFYSAAAGNNFILALSADQSTIDIWVGASEASPVTYSFPNSNYEPLNFFANGFDSSLTVDETNGDPLAFPTVSFDGGSANGDLIVRGDPSLSNNFYVEQGYIFAEEFMFDTNVGSISFIGGSGDDSLYIDANPAPVYFAGGTGTDSIFVDAGNFTFNTDPAVTTSNLSVQVASGASLTFAGNASGGGINTYHLANLSLASGALATLAISSSTADRSLLIMRSLIFDGSIGSPQGLLDIGNGDAIVRNGNVRVISSALAEGFNAGPWNGGNGIISTAAANDPRHITAVGMSLGSSNTFDGQSVSSSDVLLKYTYYGDAALGGNVGAADTSRLDFGFLTQATGWFNGDFNYDGLINGSDYTLYDNAFNNQGAAFAGQIAAPVSEPVARPAFATPLGPESDSNRSAQSLAMVIRSVEYLMSGIGNPRESSL